MTTPGNMVFVSTVRLHAVEPLGPRFFREGPGYAYTECMIIDESDLSGVAPCWIGQEPRPEAPRRGSERGCTTGSRAPRPVAASIVDLLQRLHDRAFTE
jgi:hypothetical protein